MADQVVRWYVMPLELRADGKRIIPQALRTLVQGRWTYYELPGDQWALVRVRGERVQQAVLEAAPGTFAFPRTRLKTWADFPAGFKARLTALGFTIATNPFPDEVLDLLGQFHADYIGAPAWDRNRERRRDEPLLNAVEEV